MKAVDPMDGSETSKAHNMPKKVHDGTTPAWLFVRAAARVRHESHTPWRPRTAAVLRVSFRQTLPNDYLDHPKHHQEDDDRKGNPN